MCCCDGKAGRLITSGFTVRIERKACRCAIKHLVGGISAKLREDRCPATAANECWSMDFMHDELFDGRRLRLLTIVDNFSRVSPGTGVKARYQGTDVVETLGAATAEYGMPKRIRVDNGPEFVSKELDLWAYTHGVTLDFSRPGKPTDNAFIESFNSCPRQECLNQSWFLSLEDAQEKIEAWRVDYNHVRPHSAIGDLAPIEFARAAVQACRDGGPERPESLT